MEEQHQSITLNDLHRNGTSSNRVECGLHEIVWEGTTGGYRTWHSGFLSVPELSGDLPPYTKSPS